MNNCQILSCLIITLGLGVATGYSQESSNTSGGVASGIGGTATFSVGQTFYTSNNGSNGEVNQGIQQPYTVYLVGINEEPNNISIKVFPNPTADYLTLKIENFSTNVKNYILYDAQGKQILVEKIKGASTNIDLSQYKKGTYFIKVKNQSNEIKTFKIIKN